MATDYVVDAHALIWYIEDNPRLGVNAGRIMDDPASALFLPVIALAEACWITEHGRTTIPSVANLLADTDSDPRFKVVPLDRPTLDLAITLTAIREMHDRQIIATALRLASSSGPIAVLTRDENIRASGYVPVVW